MTTALSPNPLEQLAAALAPIMDQQKAQRYGVTLKHDVTGTPSATQYSHGPQGLLTFPGVDPVVFNAAMGFDSIISRIPAVPSVDTDPTYFTLTGVTDESGEEPTDPCDDAPVAGLMKGCLTTAPFGRYRRETPVLEINRLGQRVDRADPMDLQLVGSPMAPNGLFSGPRGGQTPRDLLNNEISRKFWELDVAFYRVLADQAWSGNPTQNSGDRREFAGLDLLINTGYRDLETGNACPAVDSIVIDRDYASLDNTIVNDITTVYYHLKDRARRSGLAPVNLVLAMKPQLFYELTAIWPCSYLSYRCDTALNGTGNTVNNIDAQDAVRFRDEMRAGNYLIIDGDRVNVIVDDAIAEQNGNNSGGNFPSGCFASSIYFLPMSVIGGRSTLYLEYFQFNNPSINEALANLGGSVYQVEGAWLTYQKVKNLCFQWGAKIEPRLVLRTPWLAARIENVLYCPTMHTRGAFPDDPYYANGGKTSRTGPSYYTIWNQ